MDNREVTISIYVFVSQSALSLLPLFFHINQTASETYGCSIYKILFILAEPACLVLKGMPFDALLFHSQQSLEEHRRALGTNQKKERSVHLFQAAGERLCPLQDEFGKKRRSCTEDVHWAPLIERLTSAVFMVKLRYQNDGQPHRYFVPSSTLLWFILILEDACPPCCCSVTSNSRCSKISMKWISLCIFWYYMCVFWYLGVCIW